MNHGLSLPPNGAADLDGLGENDDRSRIRRTNDAGDSSALVKKIGTAGGDRVSPFRHERFPRPGVDRRLALGLQDFDLGLDGGDGGARREHLERRLDHVAAIDG